MRYCYVLKGYDLLIKDFRKDIYVLFGFDRGGIYRDRRNIFMEKIKKLLFIRFINCLFVIRGKRLDEGYWVLELKDSFYNYEFFRDMCGYFLFYYLEKEDILDVEKIFLAGI